MPDDPLVQAQAARERGRYPEALALLNAALEAQPQAALWIERGRVYRDLNDQRRARADFTAASEADPAGALGDTARAELLRLLAPPGPAPTTGPRPRPAPRRAPHSWARTMVVLLLVASIACALVSIVGYGRYPLRPPAPTATPARSGE